MSTNSMTAPTKLPEGYDVVGASADPLPREREAELGHRIQRDGDPEAVAELVRANLRFVVDHVTRFQGLGVDRDDLIAAGVSGLVDAARRFDPDKGVKFISYAVWWIRAHVFREIAGMARPVRLPSNVNQAVSGDDPDPDLAHLNIPPLRIDHPTSSDDDGGDGRTPAEKVMGPDPDPEPDRITAVAETRSAVRAAVDSLADSRHRYVLRKYYGLGGSEPQRLQDIGDVLGITRERVRQIRNEALAELRESGALDRIGG
ncbi:MAG: sigma-70 family RNA polymerase sigma factor [Longimicrobiales bacterium]